VTGAPGSDEQGDVSGPSRPPHGLGDDQVAATLAGALGWPDPAPPQAPSTAGADPLRDAFLASATRALGVDGGRVVPLPSEPPESPVNAVPVASTLLAPGLEPAPASTHDRMAEALDVCEAAPGFVSATVIRLPEGDALAHRCRFPALAGEHVGKLVTGWVQGLTSAIDAVGGQGLFGLVDTAIITTEAASIHLGLIDDRHAVVLVTDVPADDAELMAGRDALVSCAVAVDNLLG
jgi:hypothetical protein